MLVYITITRVCIISNLVYIAKTSLDSREKSLLHTRNPAGRFGNIDQVMNYAHSCDCDIYTNMMELQTKYTKRSCYDHCRYFCFREVYVINMIQVVRMQHVIIL
jgi:hypothetical protein